MLNKLYSKYLKYIPDVTLIITANFSCSQRATPKYSTPAQGNLNSYAPVLGESQRDLSHRGRGKRRSFIFIKVTNPIK